MREQVQQFFAFYHPGAHYRVYNLCEERVYESATLGGAENPDCLRHFPFEDHNPSW